MIRGSFRGFINGWPGIIMITISLLAIIICVCCWCTSIFYDRARRRREAEEAEAELKLHSAQREQATNPLLISAAAAAPEIPLPEVALPRHSVHDEGICPYPIDPTLDGMPRPIQNVDLSII